MTSVSTSYFYVTLFSNVSRDVYEENEHAYFTVKLAHPIDLSSTSNGKFVISEITCSMSLERANPVIIYCNLICLHIVGYSTVRRMRTFRLQQSAKGNHEFQNVQYVPVEQRRCQDIRIEFLTSEGPHIRFTKSRTPTKLVLHFRKNYHCNLYKTRRRHP